MSGDDRLRQLLQGLPLATSTWCRDTCTAVLLEQRPGRFQSICVHIRQGQVTTLPGQRHRQCLAYTRSRTGDYSHFIIEFLHHISLAINRLDQLPGRGSLPSRSIRALFDQRSVS